METSSPTRSPSLSSQPAQSIQPSSPPQPTLPSLSFSLTPGHQHVYTYLFNPTTLRQVWENYVSPPIFMLPDPVDPSPLSLTTDSPSRHRTAERLSPTPISNNSTDLSFNTFSLLSRHGYDHIELKYDPTFLSNLQSVIENSLRPGIADLPFNHPSLQPGIEKVMSDIALSRVSTVIFGKEELLSYETAQSGLHRLGLMREANIILRSRFFKISHDSIWVHGSQKAVPGQIDFINVRGSGARQRFGAHTRQSSSQANALGPAGAAGEIKRKEVLPYMALRQIVDQVRDETEAQGGPGYLRLRYDQDNRRFVTEDPSSPLSQKHILPLVQLFLEHHQARVHDLFLFNGYSSILTRLSTPNQLKISNVIDPYLRRQRFTILSALIAYGLKEYPPRVGEGLFMSLGLDASPRAVIDGTSLMTRSTPPAVDNVIGRGPQTGVRGPVPKSVISFTGCQENSSENEHTTHPASPILCQSGSVWPAVPLSDVDYLPLTNFIFLPPPSPVCNLTSIPAAIQVDPYPIAFLPVEDLREQVSYSSTSQYSDSGFKSPKSYNHTDTPNYASQPDVVVEPLRYSLGPKIGGISRLWDVYQGHVLVQDIKDMYDHSKEKTSDCSSTSSLPQQNTPPYTKSDSSSISHTLTLLGSPPTSIFKATDMASSEFDEVTSSMDRLSNFTWETQENRSTASTSHASIPSSNRRDPLMAERDKLCHFKPVQVENVSINTSHSHEPSNMFTSVDVETSPLCNQEVIKSSLQDDHGYLDDANKGPLGMIPQPNIIDNQNRVTTEVSVVIKFCFPEAFAHRLYPDLGYEGYAPNEALIAALTEVDAYNGPLRGLMGQVVPRVYGVWEIFHKEKSEVNHIRLTQGVSSGRESEFGQLEFQQSHDLRNGQHPKLNGKRVGLMVIMEQLGQSLADMCNEAERIHPIFKYEIQRLYKLLHASGVSHGDVERRHICASDDGSLRLIDFETSRWGDDPLLGRDMARDDRDWACM
ncbi:hypothetical protein M231_00453 [Tremella mesenterica]|uniref:Protein kinase domain-containing protein n=1 Tax=Tremella mesenterica TaxID=5217 RepID=A0A4Q1BVN4_TREME|nr:hypothetical protein M231_00453 [Tremella mesenterica]